MHHINFVKFHPVVGKTYFDLKNFTYQQTNNIQPRWWFFRSSCAGSERGDAGVFHTSSLCLCLCPCASPASCPRDPSASVGRTPCFPGLPFSPSCPRCCTRAWILSKVAQTVFSPCQLGLVRKFFVSLKLNFKWINNN